MRAHLLKDPNAFHLGIDFPHSSQMTTSQTSHSAVYGTTAITNTRFKFRSARRHSFPSHLPVTEGHLQSKNSGLMKME